MKLLFLGDINADPGIEALTKYLPDLIKEKKLDFVVANGENAAGGIGLTREIANDLFDLGVNCITSGNHAYSKREIIPFMESEARALRPANFPHGTPGRGAQLYQLETGRKVLVANVMGRLFMDPMDCPFKKMDEILQPYVLGKTVNAIFVDIHTETTSEKAAMANYLDGRISGIIGTHTHVPTADHRILPKGTAFQSDAGMCGNYDSVIGMDITRATERFVTKMSSGRTRSAVGEGTLCGSIITIDYSTGRALSIEPIRRGGVLSQI